MKVSATTIPNGVKATAMPKDSNHIPSQPFGVYRAVNAMPATAVGSANGRSTMASTSRLKGKVYRTSTQATMRPKKTLIVAAIREAPKLRRRDASTLGAVTTSQKWLQPNPVLRMNTADRGIRTISDRYTMVYPRVSPKPGSTRGVWRRGVDVVVSGPAGVAMSVLEMEGRAIAGTVTGHRGEALFRAIRLLTVDPIEGTMVCEMRGLSTGPSTELAVDGDQIGNVRKLLCELGRDRRVARPIKMPGGNFLTLLGVKIFQILLGDLAGAVFIDIHIDHADGRLRHDDARPTARLMIEICRDPIL